MCACVRAFVREMRVGVCVRCIVGGGYLSGFFFVGSAGCVREMRIGFSLVSLTSGAKLNSLRGNGLG